jgi:hypothetical protein
MGFEYLNLHGTVDLGYCVVRTSLQTAVENNALTILLLVGGLEHFLFSHILGIIIPTDELIFFRGVAQPPSRLALTIINHILTVY